MRQQLHNCLLTIIFSCFFVPAVVAQINFDNYDVNGFLNLDDNRRYAGVDDMDIQYQLGHHWAGDKLPDDGIEEVYLVNCKTGEYLVLGDYWGSSVMTDHVGTPFNIVGGKTCRADIASSSDHGTLSFRDLEKEGQGFQIVPVMDSNSTLGRMAFTSGIAGTMEHRKVLLLRDAAIEYQKTINDDGNTRPGAFIWYFVPAGKTENGGTKYFIYTHRHSRLAMDKSHTTYNDNQYKNHQKILEYRNRHSYLCLTTNESQMGDYKQVVFRKFAGQMFYDENDTKYWMEEGNKVVERNIPAADRGLDGRMGDEKNYTERIVPFTTGMDAMIGDDANLWKIVTHAERKRYRLTASNYHPVDVSFNIENHKFYTNHKYARINSSEAEPKFGWEWYTEDQSSSNSGNTHEHFILDTYPTLSGEFHKIGTGYYDRYGYGTSDENGGVANYRTRKNENSMALGIESNYCGSIYKGSAVLRQDIKNLRPGRYIVYCRAFFAPHAMMNFTRNNGETELTGGYVENDVKTDISNKKWSHDSYLFAWTKPVGNTKKEYKRRLPSIFEGLTPKSKLGDMSRSGFVNGDNFKYSMLGAESEKDGSGNFTAAYLNNSQFNITNGKRIDLISDEGAFAIVPKSWLPAGKGYADEDHYVPRNIIGAGRFFNAIDRTNHPEANNYRIGLPVVVGADSLLSIGIDHTYQPDAENDEDKSAIDEWVCFDEFELVYLGPVVPDDFVLDETTSANNTISYDCYDYSHTVNGEEVKLLPDDGDVNRKLLIRRTLSHERYTPIMLPLSLTRKQVKEAFGNDTKLSILKKLEHTTIYYEAVDLTTGNDTQDNTIALEAGKTYIIKPSAFPHVAANSVYKRQPYPRDYVQGVQDWSDADRWVLRHGRSAQLEATIPGPIYILDNYTINKNVVFPRAIPRDDIKSFNSSATRYNYIYEIRGKDEYKALADYQPQVPVQLVGDTSGKRYKLTGIPYYEPLGLAENNAGIPPYSYYHAGGNMYFTGEQRANAKKGYSFYLQLKEVDALGASVGVFEKSIFDGDFDFEEIITEDTGIDTPTCNDYRIADDTWYTLEGVRLEKRPTLRGIYIYNGRKVVIGN